MTPGPRWQLAGLALFSSARKKPDAVVRGSQYGSRPARPVNLVLRFFKRYLRRNLPQYAFGLAMLFATNWVIVRIPVVIGEALDVLATDGAQALQGSRSLALELVVLGLVVVVVRTLSRVLFFNPGRDIEYRLGVDIFGHLLRMQRPFYMRHKVGELASLATNDTTAVRLLVGFAGLQVCNVAVAIPLHLWQMWSTDPVLTLWCMVPVGLGGLYMRYTVLRFFGMIRESMQLLARLSDRVLESYTGVGTVRAHAVEAAAIERFEERNGEYLRLQLRITALRSFGMPVLGVAGMVAAAIVLWVGGQQVIDGELPVGSLATFTALLLSLVGILMSLAWVLAAVGRGIVSLRRIHEVMLEPPGLPAVDDPATLDDPPRLELRGLSFTYPDDDQPALQDVSATVEPGRTLGIFGKTGSGKTTLVNLLARVHTPPKGTVLLDGHDATCLDLHRLREAMAVVPQSPFLFSTTLRENVRLSAANPWSDRIEATADDDPRLHEVLAAACLEDDVRQLPQGLLTVVGERGVMLSGGQRQRASLARALYRARPLLLLDDVLSAVDQGTEVRLVQAIRNLRGGSVTEHPPTTIIVSHRTSVLEHADEILVLDHGRVIERGTHAALVARGGVYAETHQHQGTEPHRAHPRPRTCAHAHRSGPRRLAMSDQSTSGGQVSSIALLRRFWSFGRPHQRWVWVGLSLIPLVAGMAALRPLLVKHAVDENIPQANTLGLRFTAMLFLGAVIAEFLCSAAQIYALQRAGHAIIYDVRRTVFAHVLRLPARFFDRNALGSLLTRTTSDVEALSETMTFGVFAILTDIVIIGSILVAMFVLSPMLTLITLAVAPVLFVLVRYVGAALRRLQLEVRKAQSRQTGFLAEQLSGVTVVQLFGREQSARDEYARLGDRYLSANKWANWLDALLYSLMDGISAFAIALLLYFAAPEVAREGGSLSLGLLFAFVDYLQRVFGPIKEFSGKLASIQRATASLERIYGLLDEPTEERAKPGAADPLARWRGGLCVRDLRFRYKEEGEDVLRGLSFDVAPGEVVAVVGRTGSGKSSLGRVLTRFYDGYRGSVRLADGDAANPESAGSELREVAPDQLRRHVLMVQQDVFLFNEDVAYNISLGEAPLRDDPERLRRALAVVQAEEVVKARGGLDFPVGERGGNLSAGEAQLVAFARVAAREPTLLILDEATANVDSLTEQKVQAAIEQLLQGRSVLVIAHRLSTVRRADRILVLSAGTVAEQGTHEELLAHGGLYAELVSMGFKEPEGEDAVVPSTGAAASA
jgi:ABC-type multidrug transport system fused ATPase/permease subunit